MATFDNTSAFVTWSNLALIVKNREKCTGKMIVFSFWLQMGSTSPCTNFHLSRGEGDFLFWTDYESVSVYMLKTVDDSLTQHVALK